MRFMVLINGLERPEYWLCLMVAVSIIDSLSSGCLLDVFSITVVIFDVLLAVLVCLTVPTLRRSHEVEGRARKALFLMQELVAV